MLSRAYDSLLQGKLSQGAEQGGVLVGDYLAVPQLDVQKVASRSIIKRIEDFVHL